MEPWKCGLFTDETKTKNKFKLLRLVLDQTKEKVPNLNQRNQKKKKKLEKRKMRWEARRNMYKSHAYNLKTK